MWRVALIAAMLLAGCTREAFERRVTDRFTEPRPLPERPADGCFSEQLRKYVGQEESVLYGLVFAQPMRIVRDGEALGEDYNPARLNFDVSSGGIITRVWCG